MTDNPDGLGMYGKTNPREPFCVHFDNTQPMSACRLCKDHPALQAWRDYWRGTGRYPSVTDEP